MLQSSVQLAGIAQLLGQLWLREVTLEILGAMASEEFREPYQQSGGFVPDLVDPSVVDALAVQYCELLVGPKGHISPVQSVWADNRFQSETAASMNRFFDLIPGYLPASNLSDHIGVQLDYLSVLLSQPNESSANEIVTHFKTTHLQWANAFLDKVLQRTDSSGWEFYRGLAVVTGNLIQTIE
jgi:TorA maturation chaperone TorD